MADTLSVIRMGLFAKTKTILHVITVLFVLPCLLTSVILKKIACCRSLKSDNLFVTIQLCASIKSHQLCCGTAIQQQLSSQPYVQHEESCPKQNRAHQWGSALKKWCLVLPTCVANCCASTSLLVPNVWRCPVTTLVTRTRRVRPKEDRWCWFSCNLHSSWEMNGRSLSHWDRRGC